MIYREYQLEDINDFQKLLKMDLGYDMEIEELNHRVQKMIKENTKIFVAQHEDSLVGFIGATSFLAFEANKPLLKIIGLAVDESFRNQGIGSNLLKKMEEYALENGMDYIMLSSGFKRTDAHRFYEHHGYKSKSYTFSKALKKED